MALYTEKSLAEGNQSFPSVTPPGPSNSPVSTQSEAAYSPQKHCRSRYRYLSVQFLKFARWVEIELPFFWQGRRLESSISPEFSATCRRNGLDVG